MRYISFILPAIAAATIIDLNRPQNLHARDRVATDRFRIFAEEKPILPHTMQPYGDVKSVKKDSIEAYSSFNKNASTAPSDNEEFEKPTSIAELCKVNDHYIESSGDLYHLQLQCDIITGSIHFKDYNEAIIDFGKIRKIQGSVFVENCSSLVKIEGQNLEKIDQTFLLRGLTSLVSIDLSNLRETRVIDWRVLPILSEAILSDQFNGLTSLTISDTSLPVIEGFKNVEDVDVFEINNNRFLESVKANLKHVRQKLSVHANARETELELPRLLSAENITVRDTSLVYLPKLEEVGSSLEFIQNHFSELRVSSLKSIGGTLGIIDNVNLKAADFNNVSDIQGGLMVSNNTRLEKIDFFSSLKQIGGAIYFEGRFSDTDFQQLKLVKGSAFIKTNSETMDCSKWTTPKNGRSIVRGGKISCISGRRQKAQSVNQDGTVLSETDSEYEGTSNLGDGNTSSDYLSGKAQSVSAITKQPAIMWVLAAFFIAAFGHCLS